MYDADKPMLVGLIMLISTLLGLLATGMLGGNSLFPPGDDYYMKRIEVGGIPVHVEVADTDEKRINGLSNRERMPEDQGMLFVFEDSGRYPIWMRNMKFPLDVYWIDGHGVIVDTWKNAHPDSYPQIFEPRDEAYYILEVVGGFSEVYNIEIGDRVTGLE